MSRSLWRSDRYVSELVASGRSPSVATLREIADEFGYDVLLAPRGGSGKSFRLRG